MFKDYHYFAFKIITVINKTRPILFATFKLQKKERIKSNNYLYKFF